MGIQAFCPELGVEGLDEGVVSRLAGTGEVERDAILVGPQIHIPRDEFASIIHPYCRWEADLPTHPIQRSNNTLAFVAELWIDDW